MVDGEPAALQLGLGFTCSEIFLRLGFLLETGGDGDVEEDDKDLEKKAVIWRCWLTSGDRPLLLGPRVGAIDDSLRPVID